MRVLGMACKDDLESVETFVGEWGSKMEYSLAYDDEDKTSKAYGVRGIPQSFVIDSSGRIAWKGHPQGGLDAVVEQILAGDYDIDVAKEVNSIMAKVDDSWRAQDFGKVLVLADRLLEIQPSDPGNWALKAFALKLAGKPESAMRELVTAGVEKLADHPKKLAEFVNRCLVDGPASAHRALADEALAKAFASMPAEAEVGIAYFCSLAAQGKGDEAVQAATTALENIGRVPADMSRFAQALAERKGHAGCVDLALRTVGELISMEPEALNHRYLRFDILNVGREDVAAATKEGEAIVDLAKTQADELNNFAWDLLTGEDKMGKFNALALTAAEAMAKLDAGQTPNQLDTLALAYFENGRVDDAIATQLRAISGLDDEEAVRDYTERLGRFQRAKQDGA